MTIAGRSIPVAQGHAPAAVTSNASYILGAAAAGTALYLV